MTGFDKLFEDCKGKLNITWHDEGTDARIMTILNDACPVVSNIVGLTYDYESEDAYERDGKLFDYSIPSLEHNILLNYVSYEWNHQVSAFRSAYWDEIAACRQSRCIAEETDDGE